VPPEQLQSFLALVLGFSVAGLCATGYQFLTKRPASFNLLQRGPRPSTFAAVPLLAFAAPFIIMRNTLRGRRMQRRRFEFVMFSTLLAGFWSLMSGTVVVMALRAIGFLGA
jgi:O-antigen/teichoic acid export membrane protein